MVKMGYLEIAQFCIVLRTYILPERKKMHRFRFHSFYFHTSSREKTEKMNSQAHFSIFLSFHRLLFLIGFNLLHNFCFFWLKKHLFLSLKNEKKEEKRKKSEKTLKKIKSYFGLKTKKATRGFWFFILQGRGLAACETTKPS